MDESEEEQENPTEPFDLNEFMQSKEVRKAIPRLVELWSKHLEIEDRAKSKARNHFLIMTVGLFTLILLTVIWLTLTNHVSSETVAFLLGVIITGAIAVIRDFTGGGRH